MRLKYAKKKFNIKQNTVDITLKYEKGKKNYQVKVLLKAMNITIAELKMNNALLIEEISCAREFCTSPTAGCCGDSFITIFNTF